ncbi:hypothetical protein HDU76_008330, partial [Blyttiomyces sp. JEL0837]
MATDEIPSVAALAAQQAASTATTASATTQKQPLPTATTNPDSDMMIPLGDSKLMWSPKQPSSMTEFRDFVRLTYNLDLKTYSDLWTWSVDKFPDFWESVWKYCKIVSKVPYSQVFEHGVSMDNIPRWFLGARLNYAENMLHRNDSHTAIISANESGIITRLTYTELRAKVAKCAASLKALGVQKGDCVAAYITNTSEAVIAMLAVASIGAIWSSCAPDLGPSGVLDRFGQIQPVVLFSVNAVLYNGKCHDHLAKLKTVVQGLPTVRKVIIATIVKDAPTIGDIPNAETFDDFMNRSSDSEPL